MAKYLLEVSYTAEGARGVLKEGGSARRAVVEQLAEKLGGKVEVFYLRVWQERRLRDPRRPRRKRRHGGSEHGGGGFRSSEYQDDRVADPGRDRRGGEEVGRLPPAGNVGRAGHCTWRTGRADRLTAEAAFALLERPQRPQEVELAKRRPVDVGEVELAVRALPGQEPREAQLAARPDDQVRVRAVRPCRGGPRAPRRVTRSAISPAATPSSAR